MKKLILISFLASISLYSCNVSTDVDPDNASAISGTYQMKTYATQAGTSTPGTGDKIVVSRVDNNNVKVVIDYANNTNGSDVTFDKMYISKSDGVYYLSQSFSNASSNGKVTGNSIDLTINYTGAQQGKYANTTGTK